MRARWGAVVVCSLLVLVGCAPPASPSTWQYQLSGRVDTSVDAPVYIVDGFDVEASVVDELHDAGRKVVCYINAGAYEQWRRDASAYPEEVVGEPLADWPGEAWLDIRRLDLLEPIIAARLDLCREKGFDAVEPDNVDGYTNESGFPLTAEDQLRFNRRIAEMAHERSLEVALKNDVGQVDELVGDFDFAVNESCVEENECELLEPFVRDGKMVLHVEYDLPLDEFCPVTAELGFSSIRKPLKLTAPVEPCPAA